MCPPSPLLKDQTLLPEFQNVTDKIFTDGIINRWLPYICYLLHFLVFHIIYLNLIGEIDFVQYCKLAIVFVCFDTNE